jgi:hypothetical protein
VRQLSVRGRRRADHDDVHVRQVVDPLHDRRAGIAGEHLPAALLVAGHHRGQREVLVGRDERRVEHPTRGAEADDGRPKWSHARNVPGPAADGNSQAGAVSRCSAKRATGR